MTSVAIGIGVAFGVLLLLGIIAGYFFWSRMKRKNKQLEEKVAAAAAQQQQQATMPTTYNEFHGQGQGQVAYVSQLQLPVRGQQAAWVEMEHKDYRTREPAELGTPLQA